MERRCPKFCLGDHPGICREINALRVLIDERQAQLQIHLEEIKGSRTLAKEEMERRLIPISDQIQSQSSRFISEDKVMGEVNPLKLRLQSIEKIISHSSGEAKWTDHIITVLIGAAVLLGIWLIKGL